MFAEPGGARGGGRAIIKLQQWIDRKVAPWTAYRGRALNRTEDGTW